MSGAAALEAFATARPSLEPLLRQIERAAESEAPVLLLGEPGTGRSSLGRAIHAISRRADGPLVEVDVAALPSTLFESEFFGFRKGAFTGATRSAAGRVARANGGTLLLDHVEELPLASQPKLLRLLAERQYDPVGGRERRADVRFVAIGAADLADRVAQGLFRADLYYRLDVVTFVVPALADSATDLPSLFEYFLDDLARRSGRPRLRLSDRALRWMAQYSWPGNLRQLRNVLERELVARPRATVLDPEPPFDASERPASLAEVERRQILAVLRFTRGHQGEAARILGISRKTLWDKRKRYDIP